MDDDSFAGPTVVLALQTALSELMAGYALKVGTAPLQGLCAARQLAVAGIERLCRVHPAPTPSLAVLADKIGEIKRPVLDNAERGAVSLVEATAFAT